jgi:hypothetical protein
MDRTLVPKSVTPSHAPILVQLSAVSDFSAFPKRYAHAMAWPFAL